MKSRAVQSAALLTFLFAGLYVLTASRDFSYDGLCYALDVEFSPWKNLFHPNHLLYSAIARVLYRFFELIGFDFRAIPLMQGMNAIIGGLTIGLLFWMLERDFGWRRGLLGALALGVSHVYWTEVTDPGCYAWATLAGVGLLAILLRAPRRSAFQIGLVHGALTLFHQIFALAAPAFLWRTGKSWARYLAGALCVAAGSYAAVAAIFHSGPWMDRIRWTVAPAGGEAGSHMLMWWTFNVKENAIDFWNGLVQSVIIFRGNLPVGMSYTAHALTLFLVLLFVVQVIRLLRERESPGEAVMALLIWMGLMSVFHFFYLPYATRFWLPLLPAMIYLFLWATQRYEAKTFYGVAAGLIISTGMLNYVYAVGPRSRYENNPNLVRILWLSRALTPQDVFIFSGVGPDSIINVYGAYFLPQVQARSIRGYFFSHPDGDLSGLNAIVQEARAAKRRIYLEKSLFDPRHQQELEQTVGIPSGTLARWLRQFKIKVERMGPGGYSVIEAS